MAAAGQQVTFTAVALGTPLPIVQWQVSNDGGKTWSTLSGATSTTLTLNNVQVSQNGYQYRAVFTTSAGSATTSAATLTVNPAQTVTKAANAVDAYSSTIQTMHMSATVDDASNPNDTVNEGTVTFMVENGSTILGSTQGTVSGGKAYADLPLPAGLATGSYIITVSYSDSQGSFVDDGDTSGTLTITAAATTVQLIEAALTPSLASMTAVETLTAHVSSSSSVTQGVVTFSLSNQLFSAKVDGNGNATVLLTLPISNLLSPQVINVDYTDPAQDLMASANTQTKSWSLLTILLPTVVAFGPNGERTTTDLFGLLLTFTNGLLTEIDFGSMHLVFCYSASNQLLGVSWNGIDLLL
jgi:hypothetical protein